MERIETGFTIADLGTDVWSLCLHDQKRQGSDPDGKVGNVPVRFAALLIQSSGREIGFISDEFTRYAEEQRIRQNVMDEFGLDITLCGRSFWRHSRISR